jgi:hypothetical protein
MVQQSDCRCQGHDPNPGTLEEIREMPEEYSESRSTVHTFYRCRECEQEWTHIVEEGGAGGRDRHWTRGLVHLQ